MPPAAAEMVGRGSDERRRFLAHRWIAAGAARRKAATGGKRRHARDVARDRVEPQALAGRVAVARGVRDAGQKPPRVGMLLMREERLRRRARSTTRPAYMTTTSCAISATTPRLCVTNRMLMPNSAWSRRKRSRIWAWMVTSSAVVGSSAMRRRGLQASASAIIAALAHAARELMRDSRRAVDRLRGSRRGRAWRVRAPAPRGASPARAAGSSPRSGCRS